MITKDFVSACEAANVEGNKQIDLTGDDFSGADYCEAECEFYDTCHGDREDCLKKTFAYLLSTFTDVEQVVLKLRFGFCDNKLFTEKEIAQYLNLEPERVRQITAKALRKMRHPSRSRLISKRKSEYCSVNVEFYKNLITEAFGQED